MRCSRVLLGFWVALLLVACRAVSGQGAAAHADGVAWRPLPDAAFGAFVDPASLQAFLRELPVPVRDRVGASLGRFRDGEAVAIAFLGTSKAPLAARVVRAQRSAEGLELAIALSPGKADPDAPVRPYYPVAVWRGPAPKPPFAVRFVDGTGGERARIDAVRPVLDVHAMCADRPSCAGDPLLVGQTIRHRIPEGENIVRVHDTPPLVLTAWKETEGRTRVLLAPPTWLEPVVSHCWPTDLSPQEIARLRDEATPPSGDAVFRLGGARLSRRDPKVVESAGRPMAGSLWVACDRSLHERGGRNGAWLVDLYPAELRRADSGIELVEVVESWNDLRIRFRLLPPPGLDARRASSVPLRLRILDPPRIDGERVLGAFLYYGFERDPNRGAYSIGFGPYERGRYAAWLYLQETGVAEFELAARLGTCLADGEARAVADDACNTNPAVELFYSHADFLRRHGQPVPQRLRLQLVSPRDGRESPPFTVVLGDEPTTPRAEPIEIASGR